MREKEPGLVFIPSRLVGEVCPPSPLLSQEATPTQPLQTATANNEMNGGNWRRYQDRSPDPQLPGGGECRHPTSNQDSPAAPCPGSRPGSSRPRGRRWGRPQTEQPPRASPAWGPPAGAARPLGGPTFLQQAELTPHARAGVVLPHEVSQQAQVGKK